LSRPVFRGQVKATTKNIETKFQLFNQISSNQIVRAHSDITNDVAVKFQIFAQEASNQIASAYSAVTNQIADQFQEPKVRQTVENVARGEAKTILENEVRPVVEEFHTNVEGKFKAIESGEDFLELATKARAHNYHLPSNSIILQGVGRNGLLQNQNWKQAILRMQRSN